MGGGFGPLDVSMLGVVSAVGVTAIAMWIVFKAIGSVLALLVSQEAGPLPSETRVVQGSTLQEKTRLLAGLLDGYRRRHPQRLG